MYIFIDDIIIIIISDRNTKAPACVYIQGRNDKKSKQRKKFNNFVMFDKVITFKLIKTQKNYLLLFILFVFYSIANTLTVYVKRSSAAVN